MIFNDFFQLVLFLIENHQEVSFEMEISILWKKHSVLSSLQNLSRLNLFILGKRGALQNIFKHRSPREFVLALNPRLSSYHGYSHNHVPQNSVLHPKKNLTPWKLKHVEPPQKSWRLFLGSDPFSGHSRSPAVNFRWIPPSWALLIAHPDLRCVANGI